MTASEKTMWAIGKKILTMIENRTTLSPMTDDATPAHDDNKPIALKKMAEIELMAACCHLTADELINRAPMAYHTAFPSRPYVSRSHYRSSVQPQCCAK